MYALARPPAGAAAAPARRAAAGSSSSNRCAPVRAAARRGPAPPPPGGALAAPACAARGAGSRGVACRVLTESATLDIGSPAPTFELPDPLSGGTVSLSGAAAGAKATLVMFICNHCPFVVMLKPAIAALAKEYQARGVAVVAISSNSTATHPQDGPEAMAADAKEQGYTFPYLFDESQAVARAYTAACTPEFYVFDGDLRLTYHGQFDDARPNNGKPVTGADLRVALDAALAGAPLPADFTPRPSIGCNIKWHPGQEPDYFGSQIVKK
ncbi:hypothetical protein HT031_004828 [Scenedesmus sp. PABB004]|nr:hypothetical protein HT031_004828 [Scenedesmus sp. PABB004]